MRVRTGTSGFSYDEWKGSFYPEDIKKPDMLRFYATRLDTVEINNTFYRMPKRELLERWRDQVGDDFTFVLKAPQRITHRARLKDCGETVGYLWDAAQELGPRLGPILFQLPPFLRADPDLLKDFLAILPEGCRGAFEFRNDSWNTDEVRTALADAGQALCVADTDKDTGDVAVHATATWGYLRLRRTEYDDAALAAWAERVREQAWSEVFVFFKHEDGGVGPELAGRFARL